MSFLSNLLLGNGTLGPKLRAELESEGLVLVEEGLPGSIRYKRFKAPGRRYNGKVRAERLGVGISEKRLSVYCRSGRTKLIDTAFSDPRLKIPEFSVEDADTVAIRIDFDRADVPRVSGEMTIVFHTPRAALIVEQIQQRLSGPAP